MASSFLPPPVVKIDRIKIRRESWKDVKELYAALKFKPDQKRVSWPHSTGAEYVHEIARIKKLHPDWAKVVAEHRIKKLSKQGRKKRLFDILKNVCYFLYFLISKLGPHRPSKIGLWI